MLEHTVSTFFSCFLSVSLSLTHSHNLQTPTSNHSPVRLSKQSSTKKSPSSKPPRQSPSSMPSSRIAHVRCVSSKDGKERLNVEATITKSSQSSTFRCSPPSSPSSNSPQKNKTHRKNSALRVSVDSSYQQPTVSSRTRALSPYTHRKMCQLSEDARQRLSHLQLGPHHFRKETESQPPFLVCNFYIYTHQTEGSCQNSGIIPTIHVFSAQGL